MQIDDFIQVEISSRRNTSERRIDELLDRLNEGDVLLVAELSRLGRNMFEVINLINQLSESGVKLIFVRQPELSTAGAHGKLLLAIYSYFAEAEREFISVRTKQGLAAARARGNNWATQGESRQGAVLDPHRETDQGVPAAQCPTSTDSHDDQSTVGEANQLSSLSLFRPSGLRTIGFVAP